MSLLIIPRYKDKINYSDRRVFCFCIDKSQFVVYLFPVKMSAFSTCTDLLVLLYYSQETSLVLQYTTRYMFYCTITQ